MKKLKERRSPQRVRFSDKICVCITCGIEFHPRYQKTGKYCTRKCINYDLVFPKQTEEFAFNDLKRRFEEKVIKNEVGCWGWKGYLNRFGYGAIGYKKKEIRAHRASWIIYNGLIPEDLYVLHKCDNPPCTNPDHLWLGTYADNNRDMQNKGRKHIPSGEKSPRALITDAQALEIKIARKNGVTRKELALKYNINEWVIRHMDNGATWTHIKIEETK